MKIEQMWAEMEAEPRALSSWIVRGALPTLDCPLLVGLESATRYRALLLPISPGAMKRRSEWPDCQGLEIGLVDIGSQTCFVARLCDRSGADVFAAIAEDVAPKVASAVGMDAAVRELWSRLRKWQHFLAAVRGGLGVDAQRGLFGELLVLQRHLLPVMGASSSVFGWKGPNAAHQDFQFENGAIEVKTTSAKRPHAVQVASERQLDDVGVGSLFLHVVIVDDREVLEVSDHEGSTLAGVVDELRQTLAISAVARAEFEDKLLQSGWLEAHRDRYGVRRLTVRGERTFRVVHGFPRLVESALPTGIGGVSYSLDLGACQAFEASATEMTSAMASAAT